MVTACHDLSDGGLGVALAEMAVASGIGAQIVDLEGQDPILQYFGEDQGRYLVTLNLDPQGDAMLALRDEARKTGIFCPWIGTTGGEAIWSSARPEPCPSPPSRRPMMAGSLATWKVPPPNRRSAL